MAEIVKPANMHLHLRRGSMLWLALPFTVRQFQMAVIMPNTNPGIYTAEDVNVYRAEILEALDRLREQDRFDYRFEPIMVLYITPQTTPEVVESAFYAGAQAGKLYPKGGTTNSEDGIEYYWQLYPVFKKMEALGMLLLIHGEVIRYEEDMRELMFLPILDEIATMFPRLKIVLEHISNFESIGVVKSHPNVAATITLHHPFRTATDLMGHKFRAHEYWKPRVKKEHDRLFIEQTMMSGHPRFFNGNDSAPHPIGDKQGHECCAGVFSEPVALALLAELFDRNHNMTGLEPFASQFGPEWYDVKPDQSQKVQLKTVPWTVPIVYKGQEGDEPLEVIPFLAGREMPWQVVPYWEATA